MRKTRNSERERVTSRVPPTFLSDKELLSLHASTTDFPCVWMKSEWDVLTEREKFLIIIIELGKAITLTFRPDARKQKKFTTYIGIKLRQTRKKSFTLVYMLNTYFEMDERILDRLLIRKRAPSVHKLDGAHNTIPFNTLHISVENVYYKTLILLWLELL